MPNSILNLSYDEELVTHRRRRLRDAKPPFLIVGTGDSNRNGASMDLLDTLASLPPSSIKLFRAMVKARNVDTNEVVRTRLLSPEVDSRFVQNHLPALMECDLIRRIQRGIYMINPLAVMPPNGNAARTAWAGLSCVAEHSENTTAPTP
jgi:hypothetical protein